MDPASPAKRQWMRGPLRALTATHLVLFVLVGAIGLGGFVVTDFGQSFDDYRSFHYAEDVIKAYAGSEAHLDHHILENYGPAHLVFAVGVGKVASSLIPAWREVDGRHMANFLVYLLGCIAFFYLARRFFPWVESGVLTALFSTQPLLLGHGFINPKDAPFMAMTVITLATGLYAIERAQRSFSSQAGARSGQDGRSLRSSARSEWKAHSPTTQSLLVILLAGDFLFILDLAAKWSLYPALQRQLASAYRGSAIFPIQGLFNAVAEDAYKTPLGLYMRKLELIYDWARVALILVLVGVGAAILKAGFPRTVRHFWREYGAAIAAIGAAAVPLGVATSIRVAGPFVGLLVSVQLILGLKKGNWGLLTFYWLIAGSITYLTWPYLWLSPFSKLLESAALMADFPSHQVLYMGTVFNSESLPWHYYPVLVGIQLTVPAILLALVGCALTPSWLRDHPDKRREFVLALLMFLIPAVSAVAFHVPLYGNIRQVLFSLPPLFLIGGVAIRRGIRHRWLGHTGSLAGLGLLLIPGIVGAIRLHPYQYSYYNALVGGVSGAYGSYQVDPWCTSYREAMEYINRVAEPESEIGVRAPMEAARTFAREDLSVHEVIDSQSSPDYVLLCRLDLGDGSKFKDYQEVNYVKLGDAILSVVMRRRAPE